VFQTRESAEVLLQTEQMGRSFVEWLKLHQPTSRPSSIPCPPAIRSPSPRASRTGAALRDACLAFASAGPKT
jgi:urease accessory protein